MNDIDQSIDNDIYYQKHERNKKCAICKSPAEDSIEFECGNGAENSVDMYLCESHLAECEKDECAFQDKYAEKIESEWLSDMLSYADSLHDGGL